MIFDTLLGLLPIPVDSMVRCASLPFYPALAESFPLLIVAVTRAQALLVVVGDPEVLSLDPLWRSFLNYVYLNGGWTGPDITWDPRVEVDEEGGYDKAVREAANIDMNEFTRRIETMTMAEVDDEVEGNVDRPWRDLE